MRGNIFAKSIGLFSTAASTLLVLFYLLFVDEFTALSYLNIVFLLFGIFIGSIFTYIIKPKNETDENQLPFYFQLAVVASNYGFLTLVIVLLSNVLPFFKVILFLQLLVLMVFMGIFFYFFLGIKNSKQIDACSKKRELSLLNLKKTVQLACHKVNTTEHENSEELKAALKSIEADVSFLTAVNNEKTITMDESISSSIKQLVNNMDLTLIAEINSLIKERKQIRSV